MKGKTKHFLAGTAISLLLSFLAAQAAVDSPIMVWWVVVSALSLFVALFCFVSAMVMQFDD